MRLKTAVKTHVGNQAVAASRAGIARQSLVEILAGRQTPTNGTFNALLRVVEMSEEEILGGNFLAEQAVDFLHFPPVRIEIPALNIPAAAGDGSIVWGVELGQSPFAFAEDWVRRQFGSSQGLRLVQVAGDSQLPELSDGDWVMIDTDRTKMESGLAVVLLDDCLMIKRLAREGRFMQLLSRNPVYEPIALDLSKEQDRIEVIGKVVYSFRGT